MEGADLNRRSPDPGDAQEEDKLDVDLHLIDGDGPPSLRIQVRGKGEAVHSVLQDVMLDWRQLVKERERARMRRYFFSTAHVFIFGVAVLAVIGFGADFLKLREFNTRALWGMGAWIVVSIAWLYFAIIKDVFKLKGNGPPPPGQ